MLTAVDSSVLLDVLTNSAAHSDSSEQALRKTAEEGGLIICECVLAEIRPAFAAKAGLPVRVTQILSEAQLVRSLLFHPELWRLERSVGTGLLMRPQGDFESHTTPDTALRWSGRGRQDRQGRRGSCHDKWRDGNR